MNDEENRPPTAGPAPGAAAAVKSESNALGKRKAREGQRDDSQELLECMEVEAPEPTGAEGAGEEAEDTDANEDVTFVGRTGDNALADFPHARENCVTKPWKTGLFQTNQAFCVNCFCFVCDGPASECKEWASHAQATHTAPMWRTKRDEAKAAAKAAAGGAAAGGAAGSSSGQPAAKIERWSCDKLLKQLDQVYPVEAPQPSGMPADITLRPYQRQSLAFMLAIEKSTDNELVGQRAGEPLGRHRQRHEPPHMLNHGEWRGGHNHGYRKVDREYPTPPSTRTVRGGWLCDEVGMGKTATVASLILSNPSPAERVKDAVFKAAMRGEGSIANYGLTLVITNHTLVQQWADELAKFAPGLKILTHFGLSGKKRDQAFEKLRDYDVLLTTPHITMPPAVVSNVRFHRMVVDEAHLLELHGVGTMGAKVEALNSYHTNNLWLVTGTPFSTSLGQLKTQANLLGHAYHGLKVAETWATRATHPRGPMTDNPEVVERLKKLMIKHSKSQRIGGEVALALPATDAETVWLDMSPDERLLYKHHGCADDDGLHAANLAQQLMNRRKACAHLYSVVPVHGALEVLRDKDTGDFVDHTYTLQQPKSAGTFTEATATFLRLHVSRSDERVYSAAEVRNAKKWVRELDSSPLVSYVPKPLELTKYKALLTDLRALREAEPNMRVVVFTEYDEVQQRLVELLRPQRGTSRASTSGGASSSAEADRPSKRHSGGDRSGTRSSRSTADSPSTPSDADAEMAGSADDVAEVGGPSAAEQGDGEKDGALGVDGLQIYEFNAKTPPARRHKLIKEFQEGTDEGAKVFVVTFRTAAVGITLTAANRVYLFEPSLDPAQEIQAAGRIHRLGQKKEVLVKRFVFRQSVEEAILDLHAKISSGDVVITDGKFSKSAVELFQQHGVEQPHELVPDEDGEYVDKKVDSYCHYDTSGNSTYGKRVQETPCRICGTKHEEKGTTTWWGKGYYAYMDGATTDKEPPRPTNWHSNMNYNTGRWQPPVGATTGAAGPSGTQSEDAKPEDLDAKPVPVMSLQPAAAAGPPVISLDSDDED